MKSLPETGFLRLPQIIGDSNHPPLIPAKRSTIYLWIKQGKFPAPVRLGTRFSAWRVEDIREWIESRTN